jgi:carbon storage regulator CsrA
MLILTRRPEEAVTITLINGQEVVVRVLSIGSGDVRLGFDAPDDAKILRDNAKRRSQREGA